MKHVKLFENFLNEDVDVDPKLKSAYEEMKKAFAGTTIDVYDQEENNKLVDAGTFAEEDRLESDDCLIIYDRPYDDDDEKEIEKGRLDGAYVVSVEKGKVIASWMPYPEEPIIGVENIIKQCLKQIN